MALALDTALQKRGGGTSPRYHWLEEGENKTKEISMKAVVQDKDGGLDCDGGRGGEEEGMD